VTLVEPHARECNATRSSVDTREGSRPDPRSREPATQAIARARAIPAGGAAAFLRVTPLLDSYFRLANDLSFSDATRARRREHVERVPIDKSFGLGESPPKMQRHHVLSWTGPGERSNAGV
jgi:hypothetical protein